MDDYNTVIIEGKQVRCFPTLEAAQNYLRSLLGREDDDLPESDKITELELKLDQYINQVQERM